MDWTNVKEFKQDGFDILLSWADEDIPLSEAFIDFSEKEIEEMSERCYAGTDFHYVFRVTVSFKGIELSENTLGSCYVANGTPEIDIETGVGGYYDQMVDEALKDAAMKLIKLRKDINNTVVSSIKTDADAYEELRFISKTLMNMSNNVSTSTPAHKDIIDLGVALQDILENKNEWHEKPTSSLGM